ncbi:MAG: hypothetical protein H6797_02270 [Candidatus Nomurabacteria bacterium]|nr:MAG: hypothetical protein H6797_02270 [Candidatus Nomurabacteria bacterium]
MGIIVNQDDRRTELQKRIAADLTDKAKKKSEPQGDMPDGVDDSAYMEGTSSTSRFAGVWILLIAVIIVAAVIYLLVSSGNHK